MKATIDIPDSLFHQAKATAAEQGCSLKDFFTEAVRERLGRKAALPNLDKPWMRAFGGLRDLHAETRRLDRVIRQEFERLDD
ncbi:MAG TPA: hypothetical protein VNX70_07295 [Bryobacteraceae bacterium]|jgi:hypothetical protein|nr:hypothetical protein [Bryobacteraceae bacterium]